jgi:hypothetical protein
LQSFANSGTWFDLKVSTPPAIISSLTTSSFSRFVSIDFTIVCSYRVISEPVILEMILAFKKNWLVNITTKLPLLDPSPQSDWAAMNGRSKIG